jgi:hypothetical protein
MFVDVVLYGGEFELLKARMKYLGADYTVVLESDHFFQGQYKGFTLANRMDDLPGSIVYLPTESPNIGDPWQREFYQRNTAQTALEKLNLEDDAVIGLFDVDEFPDRDLVRQRETLTAWSMQKYQGSLYWWQQEELTGVSGLWRDIRGADFADLRRHRGLHEAVHAGWHLSSFGTLEETVAKWDGFAHYELKRPNMAEWVERCWSNGLAIENGNALTERWTLSEDLPELFHNNYGPQHWYRKRP